MSIQLPLSFNPYHRSDCKEASNCSPSHKPSTKRSLAERIREGGGPSFRKPDTVRYYR
ncbi:hypothetical protein BDW69DRAFT_22969 [Aspergillus filifer]